MPEAPSEVDALRVVDAARLRLALVEVQRQQERNFVTGIRLAHAKAMVKAAERLLDRARAARQSPLDFGPEDAAH
jgi:hypothetical protein